MTGESKEEGGVGLDGEFRKEDSPQIDSVILEITNREMKSPILETLGRLTWFIFRMSLG